MIDGEVVRTKGGMAIKYCSKCHGTYSCSIRVEEIAKERGIDVLRLCCIWNKKNRLQKFLERQSPPKWIEIQNGPEDIETMDEYYDRTR